MHLVASTLEVGYVLLGLFGALVLCRAMARVARQVDRPAHAVTSALLGLLVLFGLLGALAVGVVVARRLLSGFFAIRLLAWAVFLHGPVTLAGLAWVMRRGAPAFAGACAVAAAGVVGVALMAFVVEPRDLRVERHEVAAPALDRPLRVVVLADLQTDVVGDHERRALRWAADHEPDLVLVAGDLIQEEADERRAALQQELREAWVASGLAPPLGAVVVQGDIDRVPRWDAPLRGLPGVTISAETRRVTRPGVTIDALSLRDSRNTGLALAPVTSGLHIVLGHAPDYAMAALDADVLVAGHTHGGQVCIPGFGPILTLSRVPRDWASGRTELPTGGTLLVSRGVGMERDMAPRLRLFCPPEVMVVDLAPRPGGGGFDVDVDAPRR